MRAFFFVSFCLFFLIFLNAVFSHKLKSQKSPRSFADQNRNFSFFLFLFFCFRFFVKLTEKRLMSSSTDLSPAIPVVLTPLVKPTAPRKPPKVPRYRPGVAPHYANDGDTSQAAGPPLLLKPAKREKISSSSGRSGGPVEAAVLSVQEEDPRLQRMRKRGKMENTNTSRRRTHHAEILCADEEEEEKTTRGQNNSSSVKKEEELARRLGEIPSISSSSETTMVDENERKDNSGEDEEEEMEVRRNRARARFKKEEEEEGVNQSVMDEILPDVGSDEEEEEGIIKRREGIGLNRSSENEGAVLSDDDDDDDDDEYESDSDDSDDDEEWSRRRDELQPIFVVASNRDTKVEQEKIEKEKEREVEFEKKRKEEKRKETLQLVEREIKQDLEAANAIDEDDQLETADDPKDEEEEMKEYEAWKLREIARIRKAQIEKEKFQEEQREKERRSKMTDAEIRAMDAGTDKFTKKKTSMKFLQKYYHKGAFFQDREDHVLHRDTSEPTGMDKLDKKMLPQVLQVKNFGRSSQTKYTHLVDQDTLGPAQANRSNFGWGVDDELSKKYMSKMGGTGPVVDRKRKR